MVTPLVVREELPCAMGDDNPLVGLVDEERGFHHPGKLRHFQNGVNYEE
jgi:hypothetical protein